MMGGMGSFGLGTMGGFGWIIPLLFLGLVIWGIVKIANNNKEGNDSRPTGTVESPLDILKKRYVKGEITREQFNSFKNDIKVV